MHVSADDLELYILEALSAREQAEITRHLASCSECHRLVLEAVKTGGRLAGFLPPHRPNAANQRRYPRFPANRPVSIRVLTPASSGKLSGLVVDTSEEGMKLRLSEFLPPNSTIQVRDRETMTFGEVRYCRPSGSGFIAGVLAGNAIPVPDEATLEKRRSERRKPSRIPATLRIAGSEDQKPVLILDVAETGLRVKATDKVRKDTHVHIECRNLVFTGDVRYVREIASDEFNLGINLDEGQGDPSTQLLASRSWIGERATQQPSTAPV